MALLLRLIATILHLALVLGLAPLLTGLVALLKSRLLGRRGPPLLQPYRDLLKLLRKQPLVPATATFLYPVWPYLGFAATAGAAVLVPGYARDLLSAPAADLVTLAGLLALAAAAAAAAGLETGFAFGGAGAARASLARVLGLAVFLAVTLAFSLGSGDPSVQVPASRPLPAALAMLALTGLALVETGQLPANEVQAAELAMVQSALGLEYAGPDLALLNYTAMLRLMVWLCLIITLGLPLGQAEAGAILSWPGGMLAWLAKLATLAGLLAVFKCRGAARLPSRVPVVLGVAMLLAVLSAIFGLAGGGA